ncbi:MAG: efflux RND transporter permease subunit [Gammaproteobacteria bacterium]|nr:efflux RND transporter permease subunit [Gammaproteobacteria bacterium]
MSSIPINRISRSGGLAAWSIRHPIGVSMIAIAAVVLGIFSLSKLAVDLHPHLIYPEIRVHILDPGVPATVMENQVTRQLEEQLAITEDAISVQSRTTEGGASVDLSFEYGKDIDQALRDASTRLDRAKRFLPDTGEPPIIYKRDPSQIPILEFVVSSPLRDPVELRTWVDDIFSKWFITLPGVAAAEVGGGLIREIQILPDQQRLAGIGLTMQDVVDALQRGNREDPAGRLRMSRQELSSRISGRFTSVKEIAELPLRLKDDTVIHLQEVAEVIDTHKDESLRIRLNSTPGIKLSIQKQPTANTIAVVDVVKQRLDWLKSQELVPEDIEVNSVADQSIYIRSALKNSSMATISGAILAMLVVFIFLGNLRRTLIIGSAIPIAIMVTFVIMGMGGLTLNIMTLGGLALGVGLLVDNTIVMLENIYRHQCKGEDDLNAGTHAAEEVNSAIIASTSTNLAAVLPFLFIGGLTGLLFRELIYTISAAILASMVIALTLVPALAAKVHTIEHSSLRVKVDKFVQWLQEQYVSIISRVLGMPARVLLFFVALIIPALIFFSTLWEKEIFLPNMDDGRISINITADPGVTLDEMDNSVRVIEQLFEQQTDVKHVFSLVGGRVFGRTQRETPSSSSITVQLVPLDQRTATSDEWIKRMTKAIAGKQLAGIRVRMRSRGIRGIRTNRGDDDISIRVQGPDLKKLEEIADSIALNLKDVKGLRNISHSSEDVHHELKIDIDRERASNLGLDVEDVGRAMRIALSGIVVTDFLEGDRSYDIRVRIPQVEASNPQDLESILLFPARENKKAIYLGNVAKINLIESSSRILRDNQQRIVEVSASIARGATLGGVLVSIDKKLEALELPQGYTLYDGGSKKTLQESRALGVTLLFLALFLVFVVMAIQYESLRNPVIIMLSVPFALIGVAIGIYLTGLPLSMPVKLGIIMLAGIVVNNAIVLVEYIEIVRDRGSHIREAILEAARLRLRPILMTTLTTVFGMLPLAIGFGEGAEMLRPLAVSIVSGLSFSMLVSLILVPIMYELTHMKQWQVNA